MHSMPVTNMTSEKLWNNCEVFGKTIETGNSCKLVSQGARGHRGATIGLAKVLTRRPQPRTNLARNKLDHLHLD